MCNILHRIFLTLNQWHKHNKFCPFSSLRVSHVYLPLSPSCLLSSKSLMSTSLAQELVDRIVESFPQCTLQQWNDLCTCIRLSKPFTAVAHCTIYSTVIISANIDLLRTKLASWSGIEALVALYVTKLVIKGRDCFHQNIVTHDTLHRVFNVFRHVYVFTITRCIWHDLLIFEDLPRRCSHLQCLVLQGIQFYTCTADLACITSQCPALEKLQVWDCKWFFSDTLNDYLAAGSSHLHFVYITPLHAGDIQCIDYIVAGAQRTLQILFIEMMQNIQCCEYIASALDVIAE